MLSDNLSLMTISHYVTLLTATQITYTLP